MTEKLIKSRFWIILAFIFLSALLMPSQFRKGGINDLLLTLIPVSALVLSFFYVFFLRNIPPQERMIIPIILWPVVYFSMTMVFEIVLDLIFDEYELGVSKTEATTFFVNLFYYCLITMPILGLMKMYSIFFPYK